jgi:hypothetical protein
MYHIVWIPRYRYQVFVNGVDEYLKIKLVNIGGPCLTGSGEWRIFPSDSRLRIGAVGKR